MPEARFCLDTGVWIKYLVVEEPVDLGEAARALVQRGTDAGHFVAPAFAWTEFGSVLREKIRQGSIGSGEADEVWQLFNRLPIEYRNELSLRHRAWEIAAQFNLPTLHDASFLACAEGIGEDGACAFWTTDQGLLRSLGTDRPDYVHDLAESAP